MHGTTPCWPDCRLQRTRSGTDGSDTSDQVDDGCVGIDREQFR